MNHYDHTFSAICPSDGATVIYHLCLKTEAVVMVEDIAAACRFSTPKYHEALADELHAKFGGKQKISALHQGVHITTTRAIPQPSPGEAQPQPVGYMRSVARSRRERSQEHPQVRVGAPTSCRRNCGLTLRMG